MSRYFCRQTYGSHRSAGIDPSIVLPLVDAGTNREELRNNLNYLGNRHVNVCNEI